MAAKVVKLPVLGVSPLLPQGTQMFRLVVVVAMTVSFTPGLRQDQDADPVTQQNSPAESEADKPAELTPKQLAAQEKKLKEINDLITEAGLMFKRKAYPGSTKNIKKAKQLMGELVSQGDEELLKKLEHDYSRLQTAQTLLDGQGQKLDPLPALKDMGALAPKKEGKDATRQVSFTKHIAPILMQRCARCHIQDAKGGFSSSSFAAIKKGSKNGQVLNAGDPAHSSLFTLVESGKMPPRSKGIPKQELQRLQEWIAQGANYDGPNEDDELTTLVEGTSDNGNRRRDR
jgi:signal recognition particle subunit SEC65